MVHKNIQNAFKYILIFLLILYSISCLHPTFTLDESFTFGLVQHHISQLISLDSMDVHPPLYYILLKIFLIITSFWTNSIIIKVIFARLFSLICLVVFIVTSSKIFSLYNIHVSNIYYLITLLLMPPVIMYGFKIRMYALATTFVILTLYQLLKFDKDSTLLDLIFSIFFAILSSYTFYFAGLSAGLLFVIFGIKYFYNKDIKSFFKMIISGIILLLAFIPWLPVALKQITYHSANDNGNNNILIQSLGALAQSNVGGVKTIICGIIILFLIFFSAYSFIELPNTFNHLLLIALINGLLTLIIAVILCGRNFQSGAIYPIFMIVVMLLSAPISYRLFNSIRLVNVVSLIFILLLIICSCDHMYKHIKKYDQPSITLIKNYNRWKNCRNKNIKLNTKAFPLSEQMTASEDSVYLKSLNKNLLLPNYNYSKLSAGLLNNNKNTKLIKNTFDNIKIKN